MHIWGQQIDGLGKKKDERRKNEIQEETHRETERQEPVLYHLTGDLSSVIRWRRQNDQSHTHTYTHSLSVSVSLCFPLSPSRAGTSRLLIEQAH